MTRSEFVVTEHKANRAGLHWDLRFKMPKSNMWASFAVRKGVPLMQGTKVLAVRTHDHTRDEALLTGSIKSGYGAGTFKEWDRGQCDIIKYSESHIAINFKGKQVKGIYHLINIGVQNKKFEERQYWLFKGKSIKEMMGMAGRIPSGGICVDTEEGQSEEECGIKMPWSISEGVKMPQDYAMICQYTAMKGFFKKTPAGEFLIVALKNTSKSNALLIQFFQQMASNMYLVGLVGGVNSPDNDALEEQLDILRYNASIKILEEKVPMNIQYKNGMEIKFKKSSQYLGKELSLHHDSRLPDGYYIAKCTLKKGFEPAVQYKLGADATPSLADAKKMRAFTSSRIKGLMAKKRR